MDHVQEAKRLLALTRKEHLKDIRQLELDKAVDFFDKVVRQHARPTEASSFDNLVKTAQRSIDNNSRSEEHTSELQSLMRISYAVFCLKNKKKKKYKNNTNYRKIKEETN